MKLSVWQKALVKYDSFPWKEFNAEIVEVDSTPQDKDWTTKYQVKVYLEKQDQVIFSWMKAEVNVVMQKLSWILSVPFVSINADPETWEEFVVVLDSNGQKEKRVVKTGYSDWTNTEILEWLEEGEKILRINYDANSYTTQDFEDNF
jgi:hypothetical protein